jgi:hypothetical protein
MSVGACRRPNGSPSFARHDSRGSNGDGIDDTSEIVRHDIGFGGQQYLVGAANRLDSTLEVRPHAENALQAGSAEVTFFRRVVAPVDAAGERWSAQPMPCSLVRFVGG